jgi:hypothetical protein
MQQIGGSSIADMHSYCILGGRWVIRKPLGYADFVILKAGRTMRINQGK